MIIPNIGVSDGGIFVFFALLFRADGDALFTRPKWRPVCDGFFTCERLIVHLCAFFVRTGPLFCGQCSGLQGVGFIRPVFFRTGF